jgi:hypothetical protein
VFQEQPLVAFAVAASMNLHQRPFTEHLLAVHAKRELAGLERFDRIVAGLDELPRALVPDDDVATAVLTGRDYAFE